MRTLWRISFVLNTLGAGLNLFAGFAIPSDGLILLGSINAAYAVYSVRKLGEINEVQ